MKSNNSNILLLWERIGDYHAARGFNLSTLNLDGEVVLCGFGATDNLYKWNNNEADVITLSDKGVNESDFFGRLFCFFKIVANRKISNIFIPGYGRFEYLLFIIISRMIGKNVYLFAESWYDSSKFKMLLKRMFLSSTIDGLFVSGTKSYNHFYQEIGLKKIPILKGYSAVNNEHFRGNSQKDNILLCVARYSEEKNLIRLINSFKKSNLYDNYILKLVGDGPQKEELKKLVADDKRILLEGWVNYKDLPKMYQSAKYFILPSTFEPWGLVVNEAMAAGLPVAVSEVCGCSIDLVNDETGYAFDPYSEKEIVDVLNKLEMINNTEYIKKSGMSKKLIDEYSLNNWSKNILKFVKK